MKDRKIPELLAPAGNLESFFEALDSGADAVYVGLQVFSARARANNFDIKALERMLPFAHSRGRKVYVAMNTLLKESELPTAIDALAALDFLGVDAVILQDLGVYQLAKDYFPSLNLHGSTQLTVHNSAGVLQMEKMGFKRVVLAREMTLDEILSVRKKTDLEIESFVHGSMCFSYAGSCYFSSYLGGKSSNRGACYQPCRREYKEGHEEVNPFSMGDLSTIELIPQLMESGIDSFKVEGRMKSVDYVGSVIKSYRMVMDANKDDLKNAMSEAKALLKGAIGRTRTTGFFMTKNPVAITNPGKSGNSGKFAGKVLHVKGKSAVFKTAIQLTVRDRLRVQSSRTGGRTPFSLSNLKVKGQNVTSADKGILSEIVTPYALAVGDSIFQTASHEQRGKNVEAKKRLQSLPAVKSGSDYKKIAKKIISTTHSIIPPKGRTINGTLVKVKELREIYGVARNFDGVIITLSRAVIHQLRNNVKRLRSLRDKLVWSLPLIIQEDDLLMYKDVIAFLEQNGFNRWQLSNICHFNLIDCEKAEVLTSQYMNTLNSMAARAYQLLGCDRLALSVENDLENLAALAQKGLTSSGEIIVYSNLPLYVSRVKARHKKGKDIENDGEDHFRIKEKDGLTFVYSDKPLSFIKYLKRFRKMGFRNFQIDLSGESKEHGANGAVFRDYKKGETQGESSQFNLETGLQ
ncbi:MAG: U32 family peptidase [Proteobacteria bacterium]|nr:U32 family peptidase [Pseudomonadota bacterium]